MSSLLKHPPYSLNIVELAEAGTILAEWYMDLFISSEAIRARVVLKNGSNNKHAIFICTRNATGAIRQRFRNEQRTHPITHSSLQIMQLAPRIIILMDYVLNMLWPFRAQRTTVRELKFPANGFLIAYYSCRVNFS